MIESKIKWLTFFKSKSLKQHAKHLKKDSMFWEASSTKTISRTVNFPDTT